MPDTRDVLSAHAGLPRWFDAAVAATALALLLPALAVIAVAVKVTSQGPVLFKQRRVGVHGRPFDLVKFRTWRIMGSRPSVTVGGHPLITKIGRILRKGKLDELPSFWNVLVGDMSLVGPRPEVPDLVDVNDPFWREVLAARPGITDPVTLVLRNEEELMAQAQLRFGDAQDFYRCHLQRWKLKGYVCYLRGRTVKSDLRILRDTALAVFGWNPAGPPTMREILAVSEAWDDHEHAEARWWQGRTPAAFQRVLDAAAISASLVAAYALRLDFEVGRIAPRVLAAHTAMVVTLHMLAMRLTGANRVIWRYVGLRDLRRFASAAVGPVLVLVVLRVSLPSRFVSLAVPLSIVVMYGVLSFLSTVGLRVWRRLVCESWERRALAAGGDAQVRYPVLCVGAGRAGILAVREMLARGDSAIDLVGFLDDDPAKLGAIIYGVPVLGTTADMARLVPALGVDHVFITIIGADRAELARIVAACEAVSVKFRVLPDIHAILQGRVEGYGDGPVERLSQDGRGTPAVGANRAV